jgi:hypothetical protein
MVSVSAYPEPFRNTLASYPNCFPGNFQVASNSLPNQFFDEFVRKLRLWVVERGKRVAKFYRGGFRPRT